MNATRFLSLWMVVLGCVGPVLAQDSLTDQDAATPAAEDESAAPSNPDPDGDGLEDLNAMTLDELVALARLRFESDNFLLAKNLVRVILLRDEGNIEASLLDAEMALVEGETDRARSRYRAVLAIEPQEYNANYGLGKLYARTRLYRQAKFYLERAEKRAEPEDLAQLLTLLAQTYRGTGESAKALETIQRAVNEAEGDTLPAWEYLVKLRAEGQDFDQALIDSEKLINIARREVIEVPAALERLERLYAAYNTQLEVLRSMHQTQYQMNPDGTRSDRLTAGNEVDAAEAVRRIVDVMVVQSELLRTMSYHSMLELTKQAAEFDPDNLGVQMQYGLLLKNTSQFAEAREAFERALKIDPENIEARRQLSTLPAAPIRVPDAEDAEAGEETETPAEELESAAAGG